jgi:acyl-CoA thioesterase FadM
VRLLLVVLRALLAPRLTGLGESRIRLRVGPRDLDFNLHMNNGRYLTVMDLGRTDLLVRSGLLGAVWRGRWTPLVGSALVRFRKSLRPFQAFELRTRVLCWDDRWFVFEQRITSRGEVYCFALVRALFRGRSGNIAPAEALRAGGLALESPPIPEYVRRWGEVDGEASAAVARAD